MVGVRVKTHPTSRPEDIKNELYKLFPTDNHTQLLQGAARERSLLCQTNLFSQHLGLG